ncbi:MAG TPA: SPOR domain-containing protein [Thermoanaerobaculia bacterium]|nr:SPOR domain-containing protein [Thermoanaerobaculia bacterium]
MSEETLADDQSHYEVSLTAGQAFLAFVLLLLSLAASFAFGLLIGRGQGDDRFASRKEPVVTEASVVPRKAVTREVPVRDDDFKQVEPAKITEEANGAPAPAGVAPPKAKTEPAKAGAPSIAPVPHFAQLLSTSDQKTAEALAAKLIDGGFTSAYVERGPTTEKGTIFRVRVKFLSEEEAKAAEAKLKTFSKDVWITK